ALRGIAFEDIAVERIEGEEVLIVLPLRADLREQAALRGARVDIFELLEVGRIFQIAERRDAVRFDFGGGESRLCDVSADNGAVLGENDALDQRVDRRILDASIVARADAVGRGRAPEIALLVAG